MGPGQTQIYLRLDYLPEGIVEKTGDALGMVERRVTGDLERFKKFIESRRRRNRRLARRNPQRPGNAGRLISQPPLPSALI